MEQNRPLIAVPVRDNPINTPLLLLDNDNVVITTLQQSEDGKALLLRLRSVSDKKETVHIQYRKGLSKSVFTVPPYGAVSCRVRQ
jgi:alpha-mannosidase